MNPWDLSCRANNNKLRAPARAPPPPPPLLPSRLVETLNGEQLAMLAAAAQVASINGTLNSRLLALSPLSKPPQRSNDDHDDNNNNNDKNINRNSNMGANQLNHFIPSSQQAEQPDCSLSKQPLTKNRLNSSPFGETTLTKQQATHLTNEPATSIAGRVLDQFRPDLIDTLVKNPRPSLYGSLPISSNSTSPSSSSPSSNSCGSFASGESADDLSSDSRRASTSSSTQMVSSTSRQMAAGFDSSLAASLDKRARKKDQNRRAAFNYRRKKSEERNRIREEEGRLVHIQVRLQGKIARLEERLLVLLGTNTRRISNTVGCSICFQCPLCLQSCDSIMNLRNHLKLVHYPLLTSDAWNNNRSRGHQLQLEPRQLEQYQRIFQNELINCNDSDNHHHHDINNSFGGNNINNNNDDDLKFLNNNIIVDYISNVS